MLRARFITFEGIEGAGKTTLAQHLAQWLQAQGVPVLLTREPGGSPMGASLRSVLLHATIDPYTELFLFLADRREHTLRVILPALQAGTWVLCDRYADSTLVYQGYGRGLDLALIRQLNAIATSGLTPDLTVLIDLPVELALARANTPTRFEAESRTFHQRIREGYLQEAARAPERFLILDGQAPLAQLLEQVRQALQTWLLREPDAK
ncbi:MAG: dTMP kinase [Fimbriimonadales bacterium]|nr:dTMP kinase [Fimbriimonadales bacterium]MDW8051471.1 dTMP kinase [Armatimonadota bacterium]